MAGQIGTGGEPTVSAAGIAPPATPVTPIVQPAPVAPQPLPTPPPPLEVPPASTQVSALEPTADFERKFNSMRGTLKERQGQWDEYRGAMEERLRAAENLARQLQEQLSGNQGKLEQLSGQVTSLQALQETANQVPVLQQRVDKMQYAMQFPSLVAQARVVEQTDEAGAVTQVRQNPVMDMLLSSTVEGDDWNKMAAELAATLERSSPAGLPPSRPLDMTPPGAPPQPTGGGGSIEELQAQMQAAYASGDYANVNRITMEMAELRLKKQ